MADIDGDGDLDVFLGMLPPASADFQNRLYLNDGRGAFTDVSLLRLPAAARDNLAPGTTFADLDGDGDADLCLAEAGSLVVCENDGRGFFTLPRLGVLDTGASIAAADVDGDGDLDLIGSEIVANARRHLHALDMARVDGTLRLQARHRAAGAPFPLLPFVAAGRMAQPQSLGTLGLLFLDPASLAPLTPLTMATSLVVTLALPNDPRLVGLTLHAQAAFLPPSVADWHLSGLVSEPILR